MRRTWAGLMNAHVLQARHARAGAVKSPAVLKPSRSFGAPGVAPLASAATARQGHDFARVAVAAAAGAAPIQRFIDPAEEEAERRAPQNGPQPAPVNGIAPALLQMPQRPPRALDAQNRDLHARRLAMRAADEH
jgi:hypothetical protein